MLSHPLPLTYLGKEPFRRKLLTLYHRVSKNEEVGLSRETADLRGVCALGACLNSEVSAQPWLMDSPRSAGCVTAL
jgi:hypothetical protein